MSKRFGRQLTLLETLKKPRECKEIPVEEEPPETLPTDEDCDDREDINEDVNCNSSQNSKKRIKDRQCFSVQWLVDPELKKFIDKPRKSKFSAHCKVCDLGLVGSRFHHLRHAASKNHLELIHARPLTTDINVALQQDLPSKIEGEIGLALYIACNNASFNSATAFMDLVRHRFLSRKQVAENIEVPTLGRTKATVYIKLIGRYFETKIVEALRRYPFHLITDETTDVGNVKQQAVLVRYVNANFQLREDFLCLRDVSNGATASELTESIFAYFKEHSIPMENLMSIAYDTCNTNTGAYRGVGKLMDDAVDRKLIKIHCPGHIANLVSSHAADMLPSFVQSDLRSIINYVMGSPRRLQLLKKYQIELEAIEHRLIRLCPTRWLAFPLAAERVLEQWNVLEAFFKEESKNDKSSLVVAKLMTPELKAYLHLVIYALSPVGRFSTIFQSSSVVIHRLIPELTHALRQTALRIVRAEHMSDIDSLASTSEDVFLDTADVDVGLEADEIVSKLSKTKEKAFRERAFKFYLEIISQFTSRITLNDPVLNSLTILDPVEATSGAANARKKFYNLLKMPEVFIIGQRAFRTIDAQWDTSKDEICSAWSGLQLDFKNKICNDEKANPLIFWKRIANSSAPGTGYLKLGTFMAALCGISNSSAGAERIFSDVSITKTKVRNGLGNESLSALLQTKRGVLNEGFTAATFPIPQEMLKVCQKWSAEHRGSQDKAMTDGIELIDFVN